METTHIYTLSHPITGVIRYVGKANNLQIRYNQHLQKSEDTRKSKWIRSLLKQGLKPVIESIDIVPSGEWQFWETYWIAQLKAWGLALCNGDNGGLGTDRFSKEVKDKIAATLTGKPNIALQKKVAQYDLQGDFVQVFDGLKIAAAEVGGSHANISRAIKGNLSCAGFLWRYADNTGIPKKVETRFNQDGKLTLSDEQLNSSKGRLIALNKSRAGRAVSPETRKKNGLAQLGKEPGNKGKKASPALIEQMKRVSTTKKRVDQLTLSGEYIRTFNSLKEAAEQTPADRGGISSVIKGISKHSGGFRWRYAEST